LTHMHLLHHYQLLPMKFELSAFVATLPAFWPMKFDLLANVAPPPAL
jgi:hypothetical protein